MSPTPEDAWVEVRIRRTPAQKGSAGRAALAGDVLLLAKGTSRSAAQVQVRLDGIEAVARNADSLTITLTGGSSLLLDGNVEMLGERILAAGRRLPELTRALRALGSRRSMRGARFPTLGDGSHPGDQEEKTRFFDPLLTARRRAAVATRPLECLAAFDAARLRGSFEALVISVASERCPDRPPARRALEAELSDAVEPVFRKLAELQEAADRAARHLDRLDYWRAWAAFLGGAFEAADLAWDDFAAGLEAYPPPPRPDAYPASLSGAPGRQPRSPGATG